MNPGASQTGGALQKASYLADAKEILDQDLILASFGVLAVKISACQARARVTSAAALLGRDGARASARSSSRSQLSGSSRKGLLPARSRSFQE